MYIHRRGMLGMSELWGGTGINLVGKIVIKISGQDSTIVPAFLPYIRYCGHIFRASSPTGRVGDLLVAGRWFDSRTSL